LPRYVAALTKINEVYSELRRAIQARAPSLDPLIEIAGTSWEMRDNASRRSVAVGSGIYGQRQLRPEDVDTFISADGALMAAWQRTQDLAALQGNPPRLAEAMRHARTVYFEEGNRQTMALFNAGRAGSTYPVTPAQYVAWATPTMQNILVIREAALAEVDARAAAMIGSALTWFWVSAVWLVVIGGLIAAIAWLLTRRVVAPLVALTATVGALAKGDLAAAVPGQDRRDELGEMAQAIGVLRDKALEARRLSEEAAAAQAARDARAHKMEAAHGGFRGGCDQGRARRGAGDRHHARPGDHRRGPHRAHRRRRAGRRCGFRRGLGQRAECCRRGAGAVGLDHRDRPARAGFRPHRRPREPRKPVLPTAACVRSSRPRRRSARW
jgi:HAMP domain-containing protein